MTTVDTKNGRTECKTMPCSTFMKMRGTDKSYQEALEASSKFNRRLFIERKTRIPFIDSQTRVAQTNSLLWYLKYQREKGCKSEQAYSYPVKSWFKKRRLQYDSDLSILRLPSFEVQQINENSNSTDSIQPVYKYPGIEQDDQATRALIDDWHMQEDSFDYYNDNDNDNESDYDDYEENKRKKSKRGGKGTGKKRSELNPDDKPFVCDKCGVKYKTKPGLTYHVQKMHSNNNNSTSSHTNVHLSHTSSHSNHGSDVHVEAVASHGRTHSVTKPSSEYLNADENTNSVFDSAYDDSNHNAPTSSTSSTTIIQQQQQQQHHSHIVSTVTTTTSTTITKYPSASSSSTSITTKLCSHCGFGSIDQDPKRQVDSLVSCCECSRSFHPVCLNFTANMIFSVKKYNWQCIDCKKCVICGSSENDDKLLFCDDCDRGYHMYCINPPLSEAPDGDWRCELCIQQFGPQ